MKICQECETQNDADAAFCVACGRALPAAVTGRVCPQCGFSGNEPSARYCVSCGAELGDKRKSKSPKWPKIVVAMLLLGGVVGGGLLVALQMDLLGLPENLCAELPFAFDWLSSDDPDATEHFATLEDTDPPDPSDEPDPVDTPNPADTPDPVATLGPTDTPESVVVDDTPASVATPTIPWTSKNTPTPTAPLLATEAPPTEALATEVPAPVLQVRWDDLGKSVGGRALSIAVVGYEDATPVVLVGSIQGDQVNTRDLLSALISDLGSDMTVIPPGVAYHIIPSINPDGNVAGTRRNAHNVDINRNWDTYDWKPNAEQPGGAVNGSGGANPHSEPETRHLAEYLLALKQEHPEMYVIVWHASQRLQSGGQVYPATYVNGLHGASWAFAQQYADATGYGVEQTWEPYTTSGELLVWCAEEDIAAIDIVIPRSLSGANGALRRLTLDALTDATY